MVSNGWEKLTGSDITLKITKGSSPKWQGFEYQDNGTLFVTSENVRDGFLDISKPKYLPIEFNEKLKNSQLKTGDILINIVGASIGRSCQYKLEHKHANINQAVCLFRPKPSVNNDYIQYYLQSYDTVRRLLSTQSESARPNLSLTDLRDFIFILPPLAEQQKIARILTTWDKSISTTERLIDNSKQQKKALMQQLLTGKKRFSEFNTEWLTEPLEQIVGKIYGGGTPSKSVSEYWNGNIPWVTVKDLIATRIDDAQQYISQSGLESSSANLVPPGTIIIATRMALGKAVVASREVAINQDLKAIEASSKITSNYLHYWLLLQAKTIERLGTGSTVKGVQLETIKSLRMHIPSSLEEQQKIAAVLTNADKEIELLEQQLADLQQEKKALMQVLLTGKKRVWIDGGTA